MINNMIVIVPSRSRPENVRRLVDHWPSDVDLLVCIDFDDPTLVQYSGNHNTQYRVGPRLRLGPTLNAAALEEVNRYKYIGFMGDDHLPRTEGWQHSIQDELAKLQVGVVYGNDLLQGEKLPTAVFMTSNIIKTLGYMCPPNFVHMYLDNAWLEWGRGIDRITYLPDVIIEHIHPAANKINRDAGYDEADSFMNADRQMWENYVGGGFLEEDLQKLERLKDGMASVS